MSALGIEGPPEMSLRQKMEALGRANEVRSYRRQLKVDLKAGRVSRAGAVTLLRDPPERLRTMKVFDFLIALPKVGRVKVNKVLGAVRVSPSKTVGGLTERQRDELGAWLL